MYSLNSFPDWVPPDIVAGYAAKGVEGLFDWQADVVARCTGNFIFCAPTSAGKSIVAELLGFFRSFSPSLFFSLFQIAALRVALTGRRILFVLPYIAVAKEKLSFLQKLWRSVDIQVAGYIGATSAPSREWTAAVCTIEKANSLVNQAVLNGSLGEYGMIVLDELHMVYDSSRGGTLEALVTKMCYYNSRSDPTRQIQIVGMSATLPDPSKVGEWLSAEVAVTDFRPIELQHSYSCDGMVYEVGSRRVLRRLDKKFRFPGDIDCTVGFCVETVLEKKSTLVFCSSKAEVEKIALEVARVMDGELKAPGVRERLVCPEAMEALRMDLERSCRQLDPVLARCLPRGVAYHHAGLTSEERECVEKAFRERTVHALIATSTLSSGVNLPAMRVIIKAQTRGPAALNSTSYGQMAGRAGRMGFAERGESIVTIKRIHVDAALRLMTTPPSRSSQRDASKVILEGVCSGLTSSVAGVHDLSSRLLHSPSISPEQTLIELAAQSLISRPEEEEMEDEAEDSEDVLLSATQLGRAALASSLPPDAALFVFADLKNATKALAIDTELHMMYLVTPINVSVWQGCDWNHLHSMFCTLDSNQKRIAKMIGVNERFIVARLQGKHIQANDRDFQTHLRFFSALALFDVITEVPLVDVAKKFRICRGSLQALQQQSATYAVMVVAFCNRLGWQYLRALLEGFAARLSFGVRAELTELVRVDGFDGSRARIFHDQGFSSLAQLAQSTVQEVATVLSLAVPFESNDDASDGRREWLSGEERMSLDEAARTVIARAAEVVQDRMRELGIVVDFTRPSQQLKSQKAGSQREVLRTVQRDPTQRPPPLRIVSQRQTQRINGENSLLDTTAASCGIGGDEKENLPLTPRNSSEANLVSTPVSKAPRLSIACSVIDDSTDSAMDLFSSSVLEMSLDDRDEVEKDELPAASDPVEDDCEGPGDVDDLETSLQKLNSSIVEDSFDCTVEFVARGGTQKPRRQPVDDSFDLPLSQVLVRRSLGFAKPRRSMASPIREETKGDESVVNVSADLFESSPIPTATKRNRSSFGCWTPTVASPLGKVSRPSAASSSTSLAVEDVCRSQSAWKAFVQRSSAWERVAMSVVQSNSRTERRAVALAFCVDGGSPDFVQLSDASFPGSSHEEAICPSSTQCDSVSLETRLAHVRRLLSNCHVICYNYLSLSSLLRQSLDLQVRRGVCLSLLAFLAHHRAGDAPTPLPQLAARFEWSFPILPLLKMNPRVKACAEAFVISRIVDRVKSQATRQSSEEAIRLEIEAIQVVSAISEGGFPFSRALCASTLSSMRREMSRLEEECIRLAGKQFNLESAVAVSEILFRTLRLPHPGGIQAGKRHMSTNKAVLSQMADNHPIVSKILQFRKLKHAVSQCLLPLEAHACGDDVIRTSFEVCTATGRLLSNRPNVQNVTKGELIEGFSVRSLFAAKGGRVLVAADYCQLELRVLAHLSSDPTLIKRLSDDQRDFFSDLSAEWGFPRDAVKQLCYGLIYGMGVRSLADTTKTTVAEAQRLLDSFFRSFPKVKSYIATTKELAEKVGFVSTFLGRRRLACTRGRQEELSRDLRQSVNFTIQGTASEIFKKAITNIHRSFIDVDARIAMIVHDEVIVDCTEAVVLPAMETIRREMENVFPRFKVPLRVKVAQGGDWSLLK